MSALEKPYEHDLAIEEPYDRDEVKGTDGRPVPAKVFMGGPPDDVESFRIPVGGDQGVYVEISKDGPVDMNREATISFPTETDNGNWLRAVNEADVDELKGTFRPCTVQMYDNAIDEYVTALYGFVTNIGANGRSLGSRLRVRGPEYLLETIPANATFKQLTTVPQVLRYIRDTFEQNQPLFGDVAIPRIDVDGDLDVDGLFEISDLIIEGTAALIGDDAKGTELDKRFKPNRHTLADVVNWVRDTAGARIWFEPVVDADTDANIALVAASEPSKGVYKAQHIGGQLSLVDAAVVPTDDGVNGLTLTGETGVDIEAAGVEVGVPMTGGSYPVATAKVPKLIEAQNGTEFFAREPSTANTVSTIKQEARSRLKEMIDQPSAGGEELIAQLTPSLVPYMGVRSAVDARQARSADNPTTLTHEIERVGHHAYHDDAEGIVAKTTAATSRYVKLSDIEVEWKTMSVK
jgi:hypothetical protein